MSNVFVDSEAPAPPDSGCLATWTGGPEDRTVLVCCRPPDHTGAHYDAHAKVKWWEFPNISLHFDEPEIGL